MPESLRTFLGIQPWALPPPPFPVPQMEALQQQLGLDMSALLEEYQETQQVLLPVDAVRPPPWRRPGLAGSMSRDKGSGSSALRGLPRGCLTGGWPPAQGP